MMFLLQISNNLVKSVSSTSEILYSLSTGILDASRSILPSGQMYAQDNSDVFVLVDPYIETNKYTGQVEGTLAVYATAETIQSIYSGGLRSF